MSTPTQPGPRRGIRDRFPALYSELREVAFRMIASRPPGSLARSDLTHEAFAKLCAEEARRRANDRSELAGKSESVLKACFGAACRDLLVDHARKKAAPKHGGDRDREAIHSSIAMDPGQEFDLLAVHDALRTLDKLDSLLAQIVEARVFGRLTIPECAEALRLSTRTVDRKWAFAKAWLQEQLG